MPLKLPIGIQHLTTIRNEGYLYVDKTEYIHRMVTSGKFYFLSRPRRFGKSLTVSTLAELFRGNKKLFEGLWIDRHWDWSQIHPVIHLSFSTIGYQDLGLEKAIQEELEKLGRQFDVTYHSENYSRRFQQLLETLHQRHHTVVLLIDEYDKPLIDYLDDLPKAREHQRIMKAFYSILKDAGEHLRLLFITGVSKFSQVSIFSDLNNLDDLTLHPAYNNLAGYTQPELEHYFADYIEQMAGQLGQPKADLLSEIRRWYNGYSWNGSDFVYNPFSVLRLFGTGDFQNYWFQTGTPTFLIKKLKDQHFIELENVRINLNTLSNYTLENMELRSLLFQTGYLTIKKRLEAGMVLLSYPNFEVEDSLLRFLLGAYRHDDPGASTPDIFDLRDAFYQNDLTRAFTLLQSMFKRIPSHIFIQEAETYYHSLVYLVFVYMGLYADAEVNTSDGRLDCVVKTPTHIYVLEFKLDQSADAALRQIREKGYAEPYCADGRTVVAVGVNFSSVKKAVEGWKAE